MDLFLNGFDIHHIDHNTDNNDINNLIPVEHKKHLSYHLRLRHNIPSDKCVQSAKKWHKSDIGREWHKRHAYNSIVVTPDVTTYCDMCAKPILRRKRDMIEKHHFCSVDCKNKFYSSSRLYFEDLLEDSCFGEVEYIEYIGEEDVYNMDVHSTHNFSINGGLIVHNCRYATEEYWNNLTTFSSSKGTPIK